MTVITETKYSQDTVELTVIVDSVHFCIVTMYSLHTSDEAHQVAVSIA